VANRYGDFELGCTELPRPVAYPSRDKCLLEPKTLDLDRRQLPLDRDVYFSLPAKAHA
jgi:hypothetical protein